MENSVWFAKRYVSLIVPYPDELNERTILGETGQDKKELIDALHSAHYFLSELSKELLQTSESTMDAELISKSVFEKLHLIWVLFSLFPTSQSDTGAYHLFFNKAALASEKGKTIPRNFSSAFEHLVKNGVTVRFYKNGSACDRYRTCDSGELIFEDKNLALGLSAFIRRVLKRKWYAESDIKNNYGTKNVYKPIVDAIDPFYRIDFRVFLNSTYFKFPSIEHLSGYSDEIRNCYHKIYQSIEAFDPRYLPFQGFYRQIYCTMSFTINYKTRMAAQIFIGSQSDTIMFATSINGKEKAAILADLDSYTPKVVNCFIAPPSCITNKANQADCFVEYKGTMYNFPLPTYSIRFDIEHEDDAEQAIKIMEMKIRLQNE